MKTAFLAILFFVYSVAASGQASLHKEKRNITYEIYTETCQGIKCEQTPIKSGKLIITLDPEHKDFSWGVKTENFKEAETEITLVIHLSKIGRSTYRLDGSITKTPAKKEPIFSSASLAVEGYKKGLKLTLQPFEGAGAQTRVSLVLN